MFKLFRKRRDKRSVMYGVFQKLGSLVERRQRLAADYLNRKAAGFSPKQLTVALIGFCLLFGSSSAFTIWYSLRSKGSFAPGERMAVPAHAILPNERAGNEYGLTGEEFRHIRSFRRYLDSLQLTSEGRKIYDSICLYRPGLLDSLVIVEKLYQQLKTNEDGKEK